MPQLNRSRRKPTTTVAAVLVVVLASLALAACGSSSKGASSSTATSASTSTSTTHRPAGALGGRFTAFRECLSKNGITLPKFAPGQRQSPGTHGPTLPTGVSKARYEAAVKKCGGSAFFHGGGGRFQSPAVKQALAKFATCMRANGVNVPKANTSGSGPIFNSKGLDQHSAKFKAAEAKCRADLNGAFRGVPGLRRGAPGGGPPTAG